MQKETKCGCAGADGVSSARNEIWFLRAEGNETLKQLPSGGKEVLKCCVCTFQPKIKCLFKRQALIPHLGRTPWLVFTEHLLITVFGEYQLPISTSQHKKKLNY